MPQRTDLTLLIDAPPGSAAGLRDTLNYVADHREAARAWHVIVVLRGEDGSTADVAAQHAAAPLLIELPERGPADPSGQVLASLAGPFTLALASGVVPDQAGETLRRMSRQVRSERRCAALTGSVTCNDGTAEAHALPGSLHGGAVMLRNDALRQVGGMSRLMAPGAAADLDLTCRLLRAGFAVERYEDLCFRRSQRPEASPGRIDDALRDDLIVIERYLPRQLRRRYRRDTIARARARTRLLGMNHEIAAAITQARRWAQWERKRGRSRLSGETLEHLLAWGRTKRAVNLWAGRERVCRAVIAGWHPNLYAVYRAAIRAGLTVTAIADNEPMLRGARYRGVPVLPMRDVIDGRVDGVLIADTSPATAERTAKQITDRFPGPVLRLHAPRNLGGVKASRPGARVA